MKMRFKFHYEARAQIQRKPDAYQKLRLLIPELPEEFEKLESWTEYEGDIEKVVDLIGSVEVTANVTPWVATCLAQLGERVKRIEEAGPVPQIQADALNQKVNVHVPGLGLLRMKQVHLEEDCCTDKVQELLDRGWRILAIMPQPDQRRPDYIFGRTTKEDP